MAEALHTFTMFPAFRNERLEEEYQAQMFPQPIRSDKRLRVIICILVSVLARLGWIFEMAVPAPVAMAVMALLLKPLVTVLVRRRDCCSYMWDRLIVFWALSLSYNVLAAGFSASEGEAASQHFFPLLLLLRSHVLTMLGANMVMCLTFPLHAPSHLAMLLLLSGTNASRCRWALSHGQMSWWLEPYVSTMRLAVMLPDPPPGSFTATPVGKCTVALGFTQLVVGWLLPCYVSLLLELRSRHAFLRQRIRWRRLQLAWQGANPGLVPQIGEWSPGYLVSWHLAWSAPLLLLGCWRLAEAAALYLPTA